MACIVFAFFAIVAVVIVVSVATAKQTDRDWEVAASKLGLKFMPGTLIQARRIEGMMRGRLVLVNTFSRSSGKHSTSYTRYTVRFAEPLGLGLRLTRQGFFSPLMTLFGSQDIEVGDPSFDGDVVVKGRDSDRIIEFLTPVRRKHIQRAITASRECVIDDEKVERIDLGVQRDAEQINKIVRQLVKLAGHLSSESDDDDVEPAAVVADEGNSSEPVSLAIPIAAAVEEVVPVVPLDEAAPSVSKSETDELFSAYKTESPAAASEARRFSVESKPEPVNPASQSADSISEAAEPAALDLSIEAVCGQLFDPNLMTFQAANLFEQRYQNKRVEWAGTLQRVASYASDLVFGNNPGTKVTFDICEIDAGMLGARIVQAVVQFPPEAEALLQPRVGERVAFSGRMLRCDSFVRTLFITDGSVGQASSLPL